MFQSAKQLKMEVEGDETKTTSLEEDDDPLVLSSHTLAALQEFLTEQKQNQNQSSEEEVPLVSENWNLSQFWYNKDTAETIAKEILHLCTSTSSSAVCIACPTLYAYLKVLTLLCKVVILMWYLSFIA